MMMPARLCSVEYPILRAAVRPPRDGESVEHAPWAAVAPDAELARLQRDVPAAKSRLGASAWHRLVDREFPSPKVPSHAVSRAYAKLFEILLTAAIKDVGTSLHLGEAPGGFVQALHDSGRARSTWRWRAVSLPDGPAFAIEKLPMDRGEIVYADLLTDAGEIFAEGAYDLITCDGAAEMDHDNLEEEHAALLVAQTRAAVRALAPRGALVVKFYGGAHVRTLCWLASLTQCFDQVSVLKPTTSRATNSERYCVCRGRLDGVEYEPVCIPAELWVEDVRRSVLDVLSAAQNRALRHALAAAARQTA